MPKNDKMAATILAEMTPEGGEKLETKPEVEKDSDVAFDSVADKLITAFESKDRKALVAGFRDIFSLLQSEVSDDSLDEELLNGDIG